VRGREGFAALGARRRAEVDLRSGGFEELLENLDLQLRRESREGGLRRRGRGREGKGEGGEVEGVLLSGHRDSSTFPFVKQAGETERREGEREEEDKVGFLRFPQRGEALGFLQS
jgi:hypothetical protein